MLSYHRVREAIAARTLVFVHCLGKENPADVLSKHWGYQVIWPVLQHMLFWKGDAGTIREGKEKTDTSRNATANEGE